MAEERPPVVMLDEIDNTIGRRGAAESESLGLLLAVLNSGYRRGRSVRRTTGKDHKVVKFPTFAPVVIAGISPKLANAARSRTIPIEIQRAAPDEHITEYVAWDAVPEGEQLRERLRAWADAHLQELKAARPERPDKIVARLAECWSPLFAIADAAGGDWPDRARRAAVVLHGLDRDSLETDPADLSVGVRLLDAIRAAFGDRDSVWTTEILDALNSDEEAPWASWNDGQGINARDLATRIRAFKVHRSADIKIDGTVRKGYQRSWFADAWKRYLPSGTRGTPLEALPGYRPTATTVSGDSGPLPEIEGQLLQPLSGNGSSEVADSGTFPGEPAPPPPGDGDAPVGEESLAGVPQRVTSTGFSRDQWA